MFNVISNGKSVLEFNVEGAFQKPWMSPSQVLASVVHEAARLISFFTGNQFGTVAVFTIHSDGDLLGTYQLQQYDSLAVYDDNDNLICRDNLVASVQAYN
jgi:hypothetical protein